MYFAPLDFINNEAKIVIVGITPGFTQMELAIKYYKNNYQKYSDNDTIFKNIKKLAAFAGSMRINLTNMLDELELNNKLGIDTCEKLFQNGYEHLTHMTSLIKYPIFKNGKEYTGHSPKILNSNMLKNMVANVFMTEIANINYSIIIPLGTSVSETLENFFKNDSFFERKCLYNFPHPSGANGHRKKIFNEKKLEYKEKIKRIFE
jgi:hypothetical protein